VIGAVVEAPVKDLIPAATAEADLEEEDAAQPEVAVAGDLEEVREAASNVAPVRTIAEVIAAVVAIPGEETAGVVPGTVVTAGFGIVLARICPLRE
jgi:hypothetical protein